MCIHDLIFYTFSFTQSPKGTNNWLELVGFVIEPEFMLPINHRTLWAVKLRTSLGFYLLTCKLEASKTSKKQEPRVINHRITKGGCKNTRPADQWSDLLFGYCCNLLLCALRS